jgi:hypothetical protein
MSGFALGELPQVQGSGNDRDLIHRTVGSAQGQQSSTWRSDGG